jgi:hypothetical protein
MGSVRESIMENYTQINIDNIPGQELDHLHTVPDHAPTSRLHTLLKVPR